MSIYSSQDSSLREFVALLGAHSSNDGGQPERKEPKTRLDLLLSQFAQDVTAQGTDFDSGKSPDQHERRTMVPPCTFPSFSMFPPMSCKPSRTLIGGRNASISSLRAREIAVSSLGYPIQYHGSAINAAPNNMARNLTASFKCLVEANLRQFFKIQMLRQTKDKICNPAVAVKRAASFFCSRHHGTVPIVIRSVSTCFNVGHRGNDKELKTALASVDSITAKASKRSIRQSLTLPLHMKAVFAVAIYGVTVSIPIDGYGNISGHFGKNGSGMMDHVDVNLDAAQLLSSLREKSRLAALEAIRDQANPSLTGKERTSTIQMPPPQSQQRHPTPVMFFPSEIALATPSDFSGSMRRSTDASEAPPSKKRLRSDALTLGTWSTRNPGETGA